jgi:hypothetical protein
MLLSFEMPWARLMGSGGRPRRDDAGDGDEDGDDVTEPLLGAGSPPPQWDPASMTELLGSTRFTELSARLLVALDVARNPLAVNWCLDAGVRHGHVCVLYLVTRNVLKHGCGRVPSCDDVTAGMTCALLLLLRVAQDVHACHVDMAKHGLGYVYVSIRDKVWGWVARLNTASLPSITDVLARIDPWIATTATTLPSPVWATAFRVSTFGATFRWGNPIDGDTLAFQRCKTLQATRAAVANNFTAYVRAQHAWSTVFKADLIELV